MKLPRNLSGEKLVKVLCRDFDYVRLHQEGSHIILQTAVPSQHRIAIPNHAPIRIGTLNAILNAVARVKGISKEDIVSKI
jgi:predicted RNA binding protein YcfA (HicA-like mRNA interferase family)